MKKPNMPTTRRQFLKGVINGMPVYLAMPTLVSLLPRDAWAAPVPGPMNFFYMYIPDGTFPHKIVDQKVVHDSRMSLWYPGVGALPATLPLFLKKLEPVRNDFSLISGFMGCNGHMGCGQILTGNQLSMTSPLLSQYDSIDQIIGHKLAGVYDASKIQKHVINASMTTRTGGNAGTETWGSYLTFFNKNPSNTYLSPKRLFDAVFGTPVTPGGVDQKQINVLDVVLNDYKAKRNIASVEDKQVLERWVSGYEDLRTKLSTIDPGGDVCVRPATPPTSWDVSVIERSKTPAYAENYDAIATAFIDITIAAMECGARRVGTLMMQGESAAGALWDSIVANEDLHMEAGRTTLRSDMNVDKHVPMSHYGDPGADMLNYMRLVSVNNYFMRKYRYVINSIKAKGLFNNSLAVCSYSFRDGMHKKGHDDFPFMCAGNGGGFRTGQHFRLDAKTPFQFQAFWPRTNGKPVGNFWASVLKQYGINYTTDVNGNCDNLFT